MHYFRGFVNSAMSLCVTSRSKQQELQQQAFAIPPAASHTNPASSLCVTFKSELQKDHDVTTTKLVNNF